MNIGSIDSPVVGDGVLGLGGRRDQGLQAVAEDVGGEVLEHRLMRQAGDVLKVQAMLEPCEGHLNSPPAVVELAKGGSGKALSIEEIGHQHPHPAVGGQVTDEAHSLWGWPDNRSR